MRREVRGTILYDVSSCTMPFYEDSFLCVCLTFPVFEEQRGHIHVEAWKKACHEETVWLQRQGKDR